MLDTAVTVIGREEGDVIINDPEISRKHARIEIHTDGTAWIADLGSTNGTETTGRSSPNPPELLDRQEFTCGRSTFMLLIRPIDSLSMDEDAPASDPYQIHLDRAQPCSRPGTWGRPGRSGRPSSSATRARRGQGRALPGQRAPGAPGPGRGAPGRRRRLLPRGQPSETQRQKAVRLVQEGAQIYDMGMVEDAVAKWEGALAPGPTTRRRRPTWTWLAGTGSPLLRLDGGRPRPVPGRAAAGGPGPPGPGAGTRRPREARIERAERVLREGRLADAAQAFQQLLETGPQDPRVLQGYHHTRALLAARDAPPVALAVVPARVPSLMPKAPAVLEPAGPPAP